MTNGGEGKGMMVLVHACVIVVNARCFFNRILREFNKNEQQNVGNLVFTCGSGPSASPARTMIVVIRVNSASVGSK